MAERASIGQAAMLAWRDAVAAIGALGVLTSIALAILVTLALIRNLAVPIVPTTAGMLLEFVFSCVQAFLLTPYLIAVHRHVILSERTVRYRLALREHRFQLFFIWSIALSLTYWIPSFGMARLIKIQPSLPIALVMIVLIVIVVISFIISLRLIILFPAIAVDAPGATWTNTMADTRGNAWRIFFIGFVAILPVAAIVLIVATAGVFEPRSTLVARTISVIVEGASSLLGFALAVVVASRLYQELGNRVNQPQ